MDCTCVDVVGEVDLTRVDVVKVAEDVKVEVECTCVDVERLVEEAWVKVVKVTDEVYVEVECMCKVS